MAPHLAGEMILERLGEEKLKGKSLPDRGRRDGKGWSARGAAEPAVPGQEPLPVRPGGMRGGAERSRRLPGR